MIVRLSCGHPVKFFRWKTWPAHCLACKAAWSREHYVPVRQRLEVIGAQMRQKYRSPKGKAFKSRYL